MDTSGVTHRDMLKYDIEYVLPTCGSIKDFRYQMKALGYTFGRTDEYYLIAGDDEPEERPIGIWGQKHLRYLKQHRKTVYAELLTSSKLNSYVADLNEQADKMFSRLVKDLAEKEGITEKLKAKNQMLWVQRMNSICQTVAEIVNHELIYA